MAEAAPEVRDEPGKLYEIEIFEPDNRERPMEGGMFLYEKKKKGGFLVIHHSSELLQEVIKDTELYQGLKDYGESLGHIMTYEEPEQALNFIEQEIESRVEYRDIVIIPHSGEGKQNIWDYLKTFAGALTKGGLLIIILKDDREGRGIDYISREELEDMAKERGSEGIYQAIQPWFREEIVGEMVPGFGRRPPAPLPPYRYLEGFVILRLQRTSERFQLTPAEIKRREEEKKKLSYMQTLAKLMERKGYTPSLNLKGSRTWNQTIKRVLVDGVKMYKIKIKIKDETEEVKIYRGYGKTKFEAQEKAAQQAVHYIAGSKLG